MCECCDKLTAELAEAKDMVVKLVGRELTLREALKWYADVDVFNLTAMNAYIDDQGQRARDALKGGET